MPSLKPLPTTQELVQTFHAAVGSERRNEDAHLGSLYDRFAGVGALCMRRLAEWDQGEARAIFFDTAPDDRLDSYMDLRFGTSRDHLTKGTGAALLTRPSAAAGAGTVWAGTRVSVGSGAPDNPIRYWRVTADTMVGASALTVTLPVEAAAAGPDGQIAISSGGALPLRVADTLWDNTWTVTRLGCGPGTERQKDAEARAAFRQARFDARPGYETSIANAMAAAGASVVALYQSDFLGDSSDFGLNRIYVGDSGYESPDSLLRACRLAVPKVCVAGTSVQVLPMTNTLIFADVSVRLWASPERFNRVQAQADAAAAVVEYFERRDNAFLWSELGIRAAVMKAVPNVHSVTVASWTDATRTTPAAEPDLETLFNASPLKRYRVAPWTVGATILAPS